MKKSKMTYIILTWNSEKYIKKCLDSIIRIKAFENRGIIIDNGSKDETCDILKKYERENTNINVIYLEKNYGTTKSRNMGLRMIEEDNDYVCILDSDTIVNENAIKGLTNYLDKDNKIGIIGPTMKSSTSGIQKSGRRFPNVKIKIYKASPIKSMQLKGQKLEEYEFNNSQELFEVDYLISACWIMKNEICKKIGLFDEKIFYAPEDVDYCVRVFKEGYKCVFCTKYEIIHEYQRISKKKIISKSNYEHIKGLIYYFKKYHYWINSSKIKN